MATELEFRPTNDRLFKEIFGTEKHIDCLKSLLRAILELEEGDLDDIQIQNPESSIESVGTKRSVLDIEASLTTGKKVHIEIQVEKKVDFLKRALFYSAGLIRGQAKKGDITYDIEKSISIYILDHSLDWTTSKTHHLFKVYDTENSVFFGDLLEIHTIELPKIDLSSTGSKLYDWLRFFKVRTEEDLNALALDNEEVAEAVSVFKELTADDLMRQRLRMEDIARRDYGSAMQHARQEGIAKGVRETAKRMLEGGLAVDQIADFTGLSVEEIENLSST